MVVLILVILKLGFIAWWLFVCLIILKQYICICIQVSVTQTEAIHTLPATFRSV